MDLQKEVGVLLRKASVALINAKHEVPGKDLPGMTDVVISMQKLTNAVEAGAILVSFPPPAEEEETNEEEEVLGV